MMERVFVKEVLCLGLLIGYKNKPPLWPKQKLIPLGFQAENWKHSQKPDAFYEQLNRLNGNKIDLFARKKRKGWDVWGNEVESDIDLENLLTNTT
jgi:N6-adenosine-specific RNA methylase IME4